MCKSTVSAYELAWISVDLVVCAVGVVVAGEVVAGIVLEAARGNGRGGAAGARCPLLAECANNYQCDDQHHNCEDPSVTLVGADLQMLDVGRQHVSVREPADEPTPVLENDGKAGAFTRQEYGKGLLEGLTHPYRRKRVCELRPRSLRHGPPRRVVPRPRRLPRDGIDRRGQRRK